MTSREEIRDFLVTRRARVSPAEVGLATGGSARRVPGLRREEVAALAGVSVDYYTRLERGDATGASESVLGGIGRALQLDAAELTHLVDLLQSARSTARTLRRPAARAVSPSVQRMLDAMTTVPAFVSNSRLDLVATNGLCTALYADVELGGPVNLARYTFLDHRAREFYPEWDRVADMTVALLRASAGHDPLDRDLSDLIGQLAASSADFRTRWAAHHVQHHTSGRKRIHHRLVGDLDLSFDSMDLAADRTLTITVYTAEPGSPTAEALGLLGSWDAPSRGDSSPSDRSGSSARGSRTR